MGSIFAESLPGLTWVDNLCFFILIIAAFNWGAYGFWGVNLVTHFVENPFVHYIIYGVIVLAGIKGVFFWNKCLACSHV